MSWPAVILWVLLIYFCASRGPGLLYLMLISGTFGSLQMLPFSGGVNLLPQSACAAAFVMKALVQRGNISRAIDSAIDLQRMALFTVFVIYGVFSAFVFPRAFLGLFEVVPISITLSGADILHPSSGNFTQSCYFILSYATSLIFSVIGLSSATRLHYRRALIWSAYALVVSGIIDLVAFTLGISTVLEPFRTASYAFLTDVEAEGVKRVVGLMPEASTYGTACVGMMGTLLFLRPLYEEVSERRSCRIAIVLLGIMTVLSTSSTGFIGLAMLGAVYACDLLYRMLNKDSFRRGNIPGELMVVSLSALSVVFMFLLNPALFDPLLAMLNTMVFQKTTSASYVERSMWTRFGWNAFLETGGMGAGLGSIRVSNWTVSILGSTGSFGAALMFGFIVQCLLMGARNASGEMRAFVAALKLSLLPILGMYSLVATVPDIGIPLAVSLGLISSGHTRISRSSFRAGYS
ncbi:hypothetical protein FV228_02115 [Methylobacterium sp. WL18]|uniref:hypothetical protein n=1 Tax=Methylobacterium sp. WL18 TaxID=2603897 RepID=UPI0011CBAF9E|nr:hypothetical protein [Methylobacterium sp. WL18]TXN75906.1 hypothetical protein FV228_02115 [Methylobacterium sp. WL18]